MIKKFGWVAGCAALLALPAAAYADTQDDQFINQVRSQGIGGDRDALIGFAHEFCNTTPSPGAIGLT